MSDVTSTVGYEDDDDLELLEEAAREAGVETSRPAGIAPIAAIILAGGVAAVAGAVGSWLERRRRKGKDSWGQIIDLRPETDDPVRRDKDLEFGQIVVIVPSADGKTYEVKIEVYDPDNDLTEIAKLIATKLSEGVVKPLDTIAQAAKEAAGAKGDVKIEEHTEPA